MAPADPKRTVADRIRAIAARASDPDLAALAEEVAAIEDRVLYLEAAVHHIADRQGIDPHELPDPLRPRLHVPDVDVPP